MPVPANQFWSPYSAPVHYPGSSGFITGDTFPSPYGISWDPINRRVVSGDPRIAGYDPFGRVKAPPGGYNPVAMPGVGGSNPASVGGSRQVLGAPGYNPTAPPGGGYNPFFTVQNQKDPLIAEQIQKILGQYNVLQGLDPTSTIQSGMAAADPAYKQYLAQETGAVGQWFPTEAGGKSQIQAQLDAIAAKRAAAYSTATSRAMDQLSKQIALQKMTMGGAGTVGDSSYLAKQGLDTAANLNVAEGLDSAQQARQDLLTVLSGQQSNLGTRGGLTTADLTRQLMPSQVGADWFSKMLAGLQPIAQMQLLNNFYGLGQAGQSPGIVFPGMPGVPNYGGGGGGGGGPLYNSMPIRSYAPATPAGLRLAQRGTNPALAPYNNWQYDEFGNPINSQPIARAPQLPIDYGHSVPYYGYNGTGGAEYAPQNTDETYWTD